jgi:inosine-uridine nucleoside N-ribohydrolase
MCSGRSHTLTIVRPSARGAITCLLVLVAALSGACGGDARITQDSGSIPQSTAPPAATTGPANSGPATTAAGDPTITNTTITNTTSAPEEGTLAVIVDTDLASDDIVALAYLTADPRVDLVAVSVSGTGEVTCPRGAEVAAAVLAALGRADVPVACGPSDPLAGDRTFPTAWRAAADDIWGLVLPAVAVPGPDAGAVALLTEHIASASAPVTLLTLGPLTNVALALTERPDLVGNLERVVVMGGAVDVPGNVQLDDAAAPLDAEWNFYVDPQAVADVVASGATVTLVALDATNAVPVSDEAIALLAANDRTDGTTLVRQLFERYPPAYLWDPLAAIAATDPALAPGRRINLGVVTEGAESGRTVEQADGAPVDLLTQPSEPRVIVEHLLRTLAGVADGELVTPTTAPVIAELTLSFDGTRCSYEGPDTLRRGTYLIALRPGPVQYWGAVAHLVPGATLDEAMAWITEHPTEPPPMVDAIVTVGDGVLESPGAVELLPGTVALACVGEDNSVHPATSVNVDP